MIRDAPLCCLLLSFFLRLISMTHCVCFSMAWRPTGKRHRFVIGMHGELPVVVDGTEVLGPSFPLMRFCKCVSNVVKSKPPKRWVASSAKNRFLSVGAKSAQGARCRRPVNWPTLTRAASRFPSASLRGARRGKSRCEITHPRRCFACVRTMKIQSLPSRFRPLTRPRPAT